MTIDELRRLFRYDPHTGKVFWLVGHRRGKEAGTVNLEGYVRISVGNNPARYAKAHRVAMALMRGEIIPDAMHVDHLNGDKTDNRAVNLRVCTAKENGENSRRSKNNTSGFKGVSRLGNGLQKRFRAFICHNRKQIHLGCYDSAEDAHAAYLKAAADLGWQVVRSE
jgi:hypothetical protein